VAGAGVSTVLVVGAGYPGKRACYERLAELGAKLVIADEAGHWSESLVSDGVAAEWLQITQTGDPDEDARSVLEALGRARIRPDGVLTFYENSIREAARVAAALGLPGNPPASVDAARSKLATRELSARLGLPTPRAQRVRSLDELFAAATALGFPAVVKPEFGAEAFGCVRVDDFAALPDVFRRVRGVVVPEYDDIFRAGLDLLFEEYLDGVEFDVDLVMEEGRCVFHSVSQNWPTAEPSLQESGLHCPPDHDRRAVRRLVALSVQTVQAFGLNSGVIHVEGKCTSLGPRIVEINARLGGGRIHQFVEAVWGFDLVQAQLRASLGQPQTQTPSRRPRCAVVDAIVRAPVSGRLDRLPVAEKLRDDPGDAVLDVYAQLGSEVAGPDQIFASGLAELVVTAGSLRRARARAAELLRDEPTIVAAGAPRSGHDL
jgi:biotin carboxylase